MWAKWEGHVKERVKKKFSSLILSFWNEEKERNLYKKNMMQRLLQEAIFFYIFWYMPLSFHQTLLSFCCLFFLLMNASLFVMLEMSFFFFSFHFLCLFCEAAMKNSKILFIRDYNGVVEIIIRILNKLAGFITTIIKVPFKSWYKAYFPHWIDNLQVHWWKVT